MDAGHHSRGLPFPGFTKVRPNSNPNPKPKPNHSGCGPWEWWTLGISNPNRNMFITFILRFQITNSVARTDETFEILSSYFRLWHQTVLFNSDKITSNRQSTNMRQFATDNSPCLTTMRNIGIGYSPITLRYLSRKILSDIRRKMLLITVHCWNQHVVTYRSPIDTCCCHRMTGINGEY